MLGTTERIRTSTYSVRSGALYPVKLRLYYRILFQGRLRLPIPPYRIRRIQHQDSNLDTHKMAVCMKMFAVKILFYLGLKITALDSSCRVEQRGRTQYLCPTSILTTSTRFLHHFCLAYPSAGLRIPASRRDCMLLPSPR